MKIVRLELSESARRELLNLQNNGSDLMRERSLAILHCANGQKLTWIANALNRRILTIRTWIERYRKDGIRGLERSYSPGRPSDRNTIFRPKVEEYLSTSPRKYGWYEDCWTIPLLKEQLKKDTEKTVGISTLERLLKDCGYSYKRPRKGVPVAAPSKEDKLARVQEIAAEILKLKKDSDVDVFFVDESHFSTEPYVVRGWYRRGEDFFPREKSQQEVHHNFWRIQTADKIFLLEECCKK